MFHERYKLPKHWCLYVLILVFMLFAIKNGVDLFYARHEAKEYRRLWLMERMAHSYTITNRAVAGIEKKTARVLAQTKDQPDAIKNRLLDVRRSFDQLVRGEDYPSCPSPPKLDPPAPAPVAAAGADDPAHPKGADDKDVSPDVRRKLRDRLRLQAYVREHLAAYHGVKM